MSKPKASELFLKFQNEMRHRGFVAKHEVLESPNTHKELRWLVAFSYFSRSIA